MTPTPADQCPHRCCVEDEVPHEHHVTPEACADCKSLDDPPKLRTPGSFVMDHLYVVKAKQGAKRPPKKER